MVHDLDERIEEEVRAFAPRGAIGIRVLQIIGSVPEDKQMKLMDMVLDGFINQSPVTTRVLEQEAKEIKDRIEYAEKYAKAQLDAARPMCPECGKAAKGFRRPFAEGPDYSRFECSDCGHEWEYDITDEEREAQEEAARKAAKEERDKHRAESLREIIENRPDLTEAQLIEAYWFSGPFQGQVLRLAGRLPGPTAPRNATAIRRRTIREQVEGRALRQANSSQHSSQPVRSCLEGNSYVRSR